MGGSLQASSPIWASEASLARMRERVAKPRGARAGGRGGSGLGPSLAHPREARPNRRACSQALWVIKRATSLFKTFCSNVARQVA